MPRHLQYVTQLTRNHPFWLAQLKVSNAVLAVRCKGLYRGSVFNGHRHHIERRIPTCGDVARDSSDRQIQFFQEGVPLGQQVSCRVDDLER